MSTLSILLDDDHARRLEESARRAGLTAEGLAAYLVLQALDEDEESERILEELLNQRAKVYRRLGEGDCGSRDPS